jgi:Fe-S-cluster containining protein
MDATKEICTQCRSCCYFPKDAVYFAPVCTHTEAKAIKKLIGRDIFKPFKDSKNVVQIKLKKMAGKDTYVCPNLDKKTHMCRVYSIRPLDCKTWPLFFMKKNGKNVLVCYEKDACMDTDRLNNASFKKFVQRKLEWIEKEGIAKVMKEHPDLLWKDEEDVFVVADLDKNFKFTKKYV